MSDINLFTFWGLNSFPFSETYTYSDIFYGCQQFTKVYCSLTNHILENIDGFIVVYGDSGVGKTVLSMMLTKVLSLEDDILTAYLINPMDTEELLYYEIIRKLSMDEINNINEVYYVMDNIIDYLQRSNKRMVIILDESQMYSIEMLNTIRAMLNYNNNYRALSIILVGDIKLNENIKKSALLSRVKFKYEIQHLSENETWQYIKHRYVTAGGIDASIFAPLLPVIFRYSSGVPRLINNICSQLLIKAFDLGVKTFTKEVVDNALKCLIF